LAENLAQAIGGVVCGSRPVIDQGWLGTSRLVGKSASMSSPKFILPMSIGSAPTRGSHQATRLLPLTPTPSAYFRCGEI
jgi:hypothetical protein